MIDSGTRKLNPSTSASHLILLQNSLHRLNIYMNVYNDETGLIVPKSAAASALTTVQH